MSTPPPPPPSGGGYPPPPPPPPGSGGPPPPYPEGPIGSGYGGSARPPWQGGTSPGNHQKAVVALCLGIASIVFALCCALLGVPLGIAGAVVGYLAKQEIARTGQDGAGLAQGGFVTGIIGVGLSIASTIASFAFTFAGPTLFGM
jgi:hypothetical protein